MGRLDVVEDVELVVGAAASSGAVVEKVAADDLLAGSATAGVAVNQMVAGTAPAATRAGQDAFLRGREGLRLAAITSG